MTQSEKLQKVIERAVKNGWKWRGYPENPELIIGQYYGVGRVESEEVLIFSHDFAKAYFGEDNICQDCGIIPSQKNVEVNGMIYHRLYECKCGSIAQFIPYPSWQFHIQQLALTPPLERIDYLYNFIENER